MSQFNKKIKNIIEQMEIGLTEKVTLFFSNKDEPILKNLTAKIDSGNEGLNVLTGLIIEQNENTVKFKTVNNKILKMKKYGDVIIHVGAGNKELRPIVKFDIMIGNNRFNDISFSIGDRSENDEPILICKDFISSIDCLINVNKNNIL